MGTENDLVAVIILDTTETEMAAIVAENVFLYRVEVYDVSSVTLDEAASRPAFHLRSRRSRYCVFVGVILTPGQPVFFAAAMPTSTVTAQCCSFCNRTSSVPVCG